MNYLVAQFEICPDTDRLHLQAYVQFKKAIGFRRVQSLLSMDNCYLAAPFGTAEQNRTYCTKDVTRHQGPYEFGVMSYSGKRNDLGELVELVQSGARERDLLEQVPVAAALHLHHLRRVRSLYPPVKPAPVVILLYGHPGAGKSSLAESEFGSFDYYRKPGVGDWFDGYDAHDVCVFEDFQGASSHMRLDLLLRYLDRYSEQVPTKGGHVWFVPSVVLITSAVHPSHWYDFHDRPTQLLALIRRIHRIVFFSFLDDIARLRQLNPLLFGHPSMYEKGVYKVLKGDSIRHFCEQDVPGFHQYPERLRYFHPSGS